MSSARQCRLCEGRSLSPLLKLNDLPVSHYLRKGPDDPDPRFSIGFAACEACGLLQIVDPVPADLIYADADTYTTGFQKPRHLDDLITTAIARQDPCRAIDVGCNDGSLMEALRRAGYVDVVGLEPNPVAAKMARRKGFRVHDGFLTKQLATEIVANGGEFQTVYLRHVVEHVDDLGDFFAGIRTLLRPDGVLVLELPEVEEAFALGSPAILWEEHVSYCTQALAAYLLERFGFEVLDRRHYVFGGGSIAFVARRKEMPPLATVRRPDPRPTLELLQAFSGRMRHQATEVNGLVMLARASGYRVVVYGAAPRSCMVVAVSGITEMIDFVADDREDIHDRLMPGTQRFILPSTKALNSAGSRVLCLLGVGCENEFKVRARVGAATDAEVVFVSLLPPRDPLASLAEARRLINADRSEGSPEK